MKILIGQREKLYELTGRSQKLLSKEFQSEKLLDLESGFALTPGDFQAMKRRRGGQDMDLAGYIMWLEEIGAFKTRKADAKIYRERFEL